MQTAIKIENNQERPSQELINKGSINNAGVSYSVIGTNNQSLSVQLDKDEAINVANGSMAWMSPDIKMSINKGHEHHFTKFECALGTGIVTVTPHIKGRIIHIDLSQLGQFVYVREGNVLTYEVGMHLNTGMDARYGTFRKEGIVYDKLSGNGVSQIVAENEAVVYDLGPADELLVDEDHILAFTNDVNLQPYKLDGIRNRFKGKEGRFLTKMRGPGKVWLQTDKSPTQRENSAPSILTIIWMALILAILVSIIYIYLTNLI